MTASSSSYVPMRPIEDVSDSKPTPTKILTKMNCEHIFTICEDCADQWVIDYQVFFTRTVGGRNLLKKLNETETF